MRRVQLPALDDVAIFDRIAVAKDQPTQGILLSIRKRIYKSYSAYERAVPAVHKLSPETVSDDEKAALLHAYGSPTQPLKSLREALMAPTRLRRCPFCAINEAETLDHYLPKQRYPEFAVFSKNLVPSCDVCNRRKLDKIMEAASNLRNILHPYFDEVPDVQFVALDIELTANRIGLRFELEAAGIQPEIFRHIENHFRVLDLGERYRKFSLDDLWGRRTAIQRVYHSRGSGGLSRQLRDEADSYADAYGRNHWRSVLYRTLATNLPFCDGGFSVIDQIQ